jgi:hypothetical protein
LYSTTLYHLPISIARLEDTVVLTMIIIIIIWVSIVSISFGIHVFIITRQPGLYLVSHVNVQYEQQQQEQAARLVEGEDFHISIGLPIITFEHRREAKKAYR